MNYQFGIYGDSIAFGYGSNGQSWFDMISMNKEALKSARNGEKISDVLQKIKKDANVYNTLFIAVGINDLLSPLPQTNRFEISELITQYGKILQIAKTKAQKIIVQSLLPVREELFPKQDWLNENKWCFNSDIMEFNSELSLLSDTYAVQILNAFSRFISCDLEIFYTDAVHLNNSGQNKLADIYKTLFTNS